MHKSTSKSRGYPKPLLSIFHHPFFQHTCNNCQSPHWFHSISLSGILQVSFMMPLSASGWEICKTKIASFCIYVTSRWCSALEKNALFLLFSILDLKACFLTWNVFYSLILSCNHNSVFVIAHYIPQQKKKKKSDVINVGFISFLKKIKLKKQMDGKNLIKIPTFSIIVVKISMETQTHIV